jgi:hypothetical protein
MSSRGVYSGDISPPLRGGVAATVNKRREATLYGADGVVVRHKNNLLEIGHHPVCAAKDASRHFLIRAATPPRRGGEMVHPAPFFR